MHYITNSEEETKKLAQNLAETGKYRIIALTGDLGAGKTTFVQGFAQGLGIYEPVLSPTFVLIRQHKVPGKNIIFYHVDLYRLEKISDIDDVGIKELLGEQNNFLLIEWAEKIEKILPKNTTRITIEKINDSQRKITLF